MTTTPPRERLPPLPPRPNPAHRSPTGTGVYFDAFTGPQMDAHYLQGYNDAREALRAQAASVEAVGAKYFSYGPDSGYIEHDSADEAKKHAQSDIDAYRNEAASSNEWPDEAESVCWGIICESSKAALISEPPDAESCDYFLTAPPTPAHIPADVEAAGWCEYVAGMVGHWVRSDEYASIKADEDRCAKAIAGIIGRRLWALKRAGVSPPQAPQGVGERADSGVSATGWHAALDIRTANGWASMGSAIPVLYTDTINGQQVCRDDVWLCTTAALATKGQQA